MRVYTVHEKASLFDDRRIVLVKEGFSWPVFFLTLFAIPTIIWAIYRRVWLGLVFYVIGLVVLGVIELMAGAAQPATGILGFVYALLVAAEANDWRRRSMAERGYNEIAVVIGENLEDAERRYFTMNPPPWPTPPKPPAHHSAPETAGFA